MKNLLFSALLLASLSGKAQNIHFDSLAMYSYVNVSKVIEGTTLQRRLCVRLVADNLSDDNGQATLYYELRDASDPQTILQTGNLFLRGADYEEWDGGNDFPYRFAADKLYFKLEN